MQAEYTTWGIYGALHADVTDMLQQPDQAEFYIKHFAYMLRKNRAEISDLDPYEFYRLLNADLPSTDLHAKLSETSAFFAQAHTNTSIIRILRNLDDTFYNNSATIQGALSKFLYGNNIDFEFFRYVMLEENCCLITEYYCHSNVVTWMKYIIYLATFRWLNKH